MEDIVLLVHGANAVQLVVMEHKQDQELAQVLHLLMVELIVVALATQMNLKVAISENVQVGIGIIDY